MSKPDVVVVGSVAYDGIITPVDARDELLGGSATYFSLAAAHLCRPRVVAVVGQDFGADDRALLSSRGVCLEGLEVAEGASFRWKGRYLDDFMNRQTIYTQLNVFERFHPALPPSYRACPTVFLANIHPGLQHEVLDAVMSPSLVVADTMNLWIDIAREELLRLLPRLDVLVINDEEARMLTGIRGVAPAIRAVAELGPKVVVVKKGEHGAVLFVGGELFFVPAYPLEEIVDPTGAGDSFAGGFVSYLASLGRAPTPADLRAAMVVGTVLASFTVEGFGVEALTDLDGPALNARYRAFMDMLHVEELKDDRIA